MMNLQQYALFWGIVWLGNNFPEAITTGTMMRHFWLLDVGDEE